MGRNFNSPGKEFNQRIKERFPWALLLPKVWGRGGIILPGELGLPVKEPIYFQEFGQRKKLGGNTNWEEGVGTQGVKQYGSIVGAGGKTTGTHCNLMYRSSNHGVDVYRKVIGRNGWRYETQLLFGAREKV